MVKTTITDIVSPSITTYSPDRFLYQIINYAQKLFGSSKTLASSSLAFATLTRCISISS